ncbi:MAG: DUF423 domain-containing protein [Bacteroidetes bacterium]|nr:DUF423 domain-containing protein [Bacteroidota bacterium]
MTRRFLLIGTLSGLFAVVLGAFGAHILKRILTPDEVQIFETGVRYQFYHTFALLIVAIGARYLSERWTNIAGWLFVFGILFFSGSLYLMAAAEAFGIKASTSILGPMTPVGGLLFMAGWLALFRAAFDYKKSSSKKRSSS